MIVQILIYLILRGSQMGVFHDSKSEVLEIESGLCTLQLVTYWHSYIQSLDHWAVWKIICKWLIFTSQLLFLWYKCKFNIVV